MSTYQADYAVEASILSNPCYRRFRDLPVCEKLKEDELIHLFSAMSSQTVSAGTTIYEAGTLSNQTIHLVVQGRVSLSKAGSNIYAQLGAGEQFGLFSFLDEQRKHAVSVKAVTDLELLTIDRIYFDLITLEEPELGNQMLRFMFHLLSDKALKHKHEYAAMHEFVTGVNTDA